MSSQKQQKARAGSTGGASSAPGRAASTGPAPAEDENRAAPKARDRDTRTDDGAEPGAAESSRAESRRTREESAPREKQKDPAKSRETWNSRLRALEDEVLAELRKRELDNKLALEKITRDATVENTRRREQMTDLVTRVSGLIRAALLDEPVTEVVEAPLLMHDRFKELAEGEEARQWRFESEDDFDTYRRLAAPLGVDESDEDWLARRRELEEFIGGVSLIRVDGERDAPPHLIVGEADVADGAVRAHLVRRGKSAHARLQEAGLADGPGTAAPRDTDGGAQSAAQSAGSATRTTGQSRAAPRATAAGGAPGGGGSDDEGGDDDRRPRFVGGPMGGPPPPSGRRRGPADERHPAADPMYGVNPRFPQSISAVRPPISVGPTAMFAGPHVAAAIAIPKWIEDYVSQYLDVAPESLPNLPKQVKLTQPTAYKGQDSTDAFEEWLVAVLRWLRFSRVTGDALDDERVHLVGLVLEGPAAEWYNQEVASPYRSAASWSFLAVILSLHARFVHRATSQEATEQYESVRYSRASGVAAYYGERRKWAARMVQHPDAYAFRRAFLLGLPSDIVRPMLESMGLSAEESSIEQLLQGALSVENSQKFIAGYNRHARAGHTPASTPHAATPSHATTRFASRGGRAPVGGKGRTDARPGTNALGTTSKPASTPTGVTSSSVSAALLARPRPATAPAAKGKSVDKSKVQCFACGALGHYSTESVCPKFKTASFRRMEADVLDGDTPAEPAPVQDVDATPSPEQGDDQLVGSQYDPADDEADRQPLDDYEEFEYYDEPGHEEYFGSMRVVPYLDDEIDENALADALARPPASPTQEDRAGDAGDTSDDAQMPGLDTDDEDPPRPRGPGLHLGTAVPEDWNARRADPALPDLDVDNVDDMQGNLLQSQFDAVLRRTLRSHAQQMRRRDSALRAATERLRDATRLFSVQDEQLAALRGTVDELLDRVEAMLVQRHGVRVDEPQRIARPSDDDEVRSVELATLWAAIEGGLPRAELRRLAANGRARAAAGNGGTASDRVAAAVRDWVAVLRALDNDSDARPDVAPGPRLYMMRLGAMTSEPRAFRTAIRATGTARPRPRLPTGTMRVYVTINGLRALALLDTGSTINAVSPDFAKVAGIKPFTLEDPIGLQLGCAGSRSKINFGAVITCTLGAHQCSMYADLVHLDHYDVVLGGPFCVQERVVLDYPAWLVRYGADRSVAPLEGEGGERAVRTRQSTTTRGTGATAGTARATRGTTSTQ